MVQSVIEKLQKADPDIGNAVAAELQREKRGLELIASENMISEAVMLAMATPPANKYAEGYPGRRYYGGCECVDVIETSVPASFLVQTLLMCSLTLAHRPIPPFIWRCSLMGIPLWV